MFIQGLTSQRTCRIAEHTQKSTLQICSYEKCELNTRWACIDCVKKNLHKHNSLDQGYLKDQMEFVQYLEKKKKDIQDHEEQTCKNIQDISQRLKNLLTEINALIKFLYKLEQSKNNNNNVQQIQNMINNVRQDFFLVSDENANQIIQIKKNTQELDQFQQFDQFLQECVQNLKSFQRKNSLEDSVLKQNIQINQNIMVDKAESQLKPNLIQPNQSECIRQKKMSYSNNLEQFNAQTNEAKKQDLIIKNVSNNPLAQSQIQQVQSLNSIMKNKPQYWIPPPFALSQVSERSPAIININDNKLYQEKIQINQNKPTISSIQQKPQNYIQSRDMSQGRFFNNFQGPKQLQTVNYRSQPTQQPKK